MATSVQNNREQGIGTLMKGVASDIGDLIKQEFQFARQEMRTDLKTTAKASLLLGLGVGAVFLGAAVLVFMTVHLLHWLTSPPGYDAATIPLWACHAIVGMAIQILGGVLILLGVRKFRSFNPLPDQTAKTIKENLEWITNSK